MAFIIPSFQAILFDLDGTLLDTAQDLISALYALTKKENLLFNSTDSTNALRAAAGQGCKGLIKTGFNIDDSDERYPELARQLLDHYENHLLDTTRLFPGMEEVLKYLDTYDIPWGIVTNKPEKYTKKICDGLQLSQRAKCIISGDSLKNRKPHPEPLLHACQILQKLPQQCLYMGDTHIDILASKAAGTTSLVALYGYISETENPRDWQADGYISHPKELLQWIIG